MQNIDNQNAEPVLLILPSLEKDKKMLFCRNINICIQARLQQIMSDRFTLQNTCRILSSYGINDIISLQENLLKMGVKVNFNIAKARDEHYLSTQQVVRKVAEQYFTKQDRILELGAGNPSHGAQSILSSYLPQEIRSQVICTDISTHVVKVAQEQGFKQYTQLDAKNISTTYPKESFERVISSCFIDTIAKSKLNDVLNQIKATLTKKGLFVHFSDIRPYTDTFLNNYVDEKHLMFPYAPNDLFEGLVIIDQESYSNELRETFLDEISAFETDFLDWFITLNRFEREYLLYMISYYELEQSFSDWILSIFPEKYRKIVLLDSYFQETMQTEIKAAGFQILEMGHRAEAFDVNNAQDNIKKLGGNLYTNHHGVYKIEKIPLPPGLLRLESKIHVIVAQKI